MRNRGLLPGAFFTPPPPPVPSPVSRFLSGAVSGSEVRGWGGGDVMRPRDGSGYLGELLCGSVQVTVAAIQL